MALTDLAGRVAEVRDRIAAARERGAHGQEVRIVAVTKTLGPEAVQAAYDAGLPDIGENKVQEAIRKMAHVAAPVVWHLIGHLQRNKVKEATRFSLVHSLDSMRLAEAMHAFGERSEVTFDVLVQFNASEEATKGGFNPRDAAAIGTQLRALSCLRVRGAMTMAAFDAGESGLRTTFALTRQAREALKKAGHDATELSMGMSQDYEIAVEEGATMVRLGTTLFGPRGD
jgi:PLP dependent protein